MEVHHDAWFLFSAHTLKFNSTAGEEKCDVEDVLYHLRPHFHINSTDAFLVGAPERLTLGATDPSISFSQVFPFPDTHAAVIYLILIRHSVVSNPVQLVNQISVASAHQPVS